MMVKSVLVGKRARILVRLQQKIKYHILKSVFEKENGDISGVFPIINPTYLV